MSAFQALTNVIFKVSHCSFGKQLGSSQALQFADTGLTLLGVPSRAINSETSLVMKIPFSTFEEVFTCDLAIGNVIVFALSENGCLKIQEWLRVNAQLFDSASADKYRKYVVIVLENCGEKWASVRQLLKSTGRHITYVYVQEVARLIDSIRRKDFFAASDGPLTPSGLDNILNSFNLEKIFYSCGGLICSNSKRMLREMHGFEATYDVWFRVGSETVGAHKVVMSSSGSYFKSLLKSSMNSLSETKISIEGFKPKLFRRIVEFIYFGEMNFTDLTNEELGDLLLAAHRFQLPLLMASVVAFFDTKKDTNCFKWYQFGCDIASQYIQSLSVKSIRKLLACVHVYELELNLAMDGGCKDIYQTIPFGALARFYPTILDLKGDEIVSVFSSGNYYISHQLFFSYLLAGFDQHWLLLQFLIQKAVLRFDEMSDRFLTRSLLAINDLRDAKTETKFDFKALSRFILEIMNHRSHRRSLAKVSPGSTTPKNKKAKVAVLNSNGNVQMLTDKLDFGRCNSLDVDLKFAYQVEQLEIHYSVSAKLPGIIFDHVVTIYSSQSDKNKYMVFRKTVKTSESICASVPSGRANTLPFFMYVPFYELRHIDKLTIEMKLLGIECIEGAPSHFAISSLKLFSF